jgi:Mrp family chromosome partitioning ATPase
MSEQEMPTVITAISTSEGEGFIAGTLYAQGWSVIFRAIDFDSLDHYLNTNAAIAKNALLLFGSDLPGIDKIKVELLKVKVKQVIGFSSNGHQHSDIHELHEIPTSATDLVSLVRGFIRAPLLRQTSHDYRRVRKSRVVAIGSAGSYTGCTLIAMNIAMELAHAGRPTLLIEANFRAPSIAAYLAMRNISGDSSWKKIAPNFSVSEIDQEHAGEINGIMELATSEFDYVIVDLGSISGLSNRLTDRRWTSTMTTWCCDQADELMIISRADKIGSYRLNQVVELLKQTSVRAQLSFVLNMKSPGKRGDTEEANFLTSTTVLKPARVRSIAKDQRTIKAAEDEHATLIEINERSHARKAIADLAGDLQS